MAVSPKQQKGSASGKKALSVDTPRRESVIARVASFLRISSSPRLKFKPHKKGLGTLTYRVNLGSNVFTFKKLQDARSLVRLVKLSGGMIDSVIIRTDTTKEGYIVDEREIK